MVKNRSIFYTISREFSQDRVAAPWQAAGGSASYAGCSGPVQAQKVANPVMRVTCHGPSRFKTTNFLVFGGAGSNFLDAARRNSSLIRRIDCD
jgi:hypothetical protein